MFLDSTVRKLQALLGGAVATTQPTVTVDWVDLTTTTTVPGCTVSQTNDTTAVDILAAPGASTQRKVNGISIFNADTAPVTVTVRYNDNGTVYKIVTITLEIGDTLCYTDVQSWFVIDALGARKENNNDASSAIAANSAQMTSADNAISNAVSALSVIVSNLASAVANMGPGGGSATPTSAQHSALSALVSNINSAVGANSAQMTSADNAISNAVSVLSVIVSNEISARNALSVIVSNAQSAITANSAAMSVADAALSNRISALSVVVSNAVSAIVANSAAMSVADAALSNRISALSVVVSNSVSAITANSAQMTSADNAISNAVSALSVIVSNEISARNALSVIVSNLISAHNVLSNTVSGLGGTNLDALSQAVSVLSAAVSVLSAAVSVVSAQVSVLTSAQNATSNLVSIINAQAPLRRILAGDQILSATAPVSISGFTFTCSAGFGYGFEFGIFTSVPISLGGNKFVLSFPSSSPVVAMYAQGGMAGGISVLNVDRTNVTFAAVTVSATGVPVACYIRGTFRCSANGGTLGLAAGNNVSGGAAGSSITVLAGSYGYIWKMV